ncbi:hypothetical protein HMPREF9412_6454 [Paenibacillus sp. HGF5]|nr:hypothetical protein HMPREF9412_6454 [Paenibacillus sp. HGF5]
MVMSGAFSFGVEGITPGVSNSNIWKMYGSNLFKGDTFNEIKKENRFSYGHHRI